MLGCGAQPGSLGGPVGIPGWSGPSPPSRHAWLALKLQLEKAPDEEPPDARL
jgi:hypothetical protein